MSYTYPIICCKYAHFNAIPNARAGDKGVSCGKQFRSEAKSGNLVDKIAFDLNASAIPRHSF
jgi:hypothetical protein